jgi:hypothetical protein
MSLKLINSNCKKIAVTGQRFNALVQDTLLLIYAHAEQHGDCTAIVTLYESMPASTRRQIMLQHVQTFTPIRLNTSTMKAGMLKPEQKGYVPFNVAGATDKSWFQTADETPEAAPLTYDKLMKIVAGVISKAEKAREAGNIANDDEGQKIADFVSKLKAVA